MTAFNYLGNATSQAVQVHVIQKLSNLTINIEGETVIGQTLKFEAYHFRGSDVMYYWDFGDGSFNATRHTIIQHTFDRYVICHVAVPL